MSLVSLVLYRFQHQHCSRWWLWNWKWALGCQPVAELLSDCVKIVKYFKMWHEEAHRQTEWRVRKPLSTFSVTRGRRTQRHNCSCWCVQHGAAVRCGQQDPHLYTATIISDLSYSLLSKLSFRLQLYDRTHAVRERHKALHFVTNGALRHKCYSLLQSTFSEFFIASLPLPNLKTFHGPPHTASSTFRVPLVGKYIRTHTVMNGNRFR